MVGVTGSTGKTSTKDLLAAALGRQYRVSASAKSFNNELGVPLTLCRLEPETEVIPVLGGKEGVAHVALATLDPGDTALAPVASVRRMLALEKPPNRTSNVSSTTRLAPTLAAARPNSSAPPRRPQAPAA